MKIVAECNHRLMLIDEKNELSENVKCRVYNMQTNELYQYKTVGCWTARVFPWVKPSKAYEKEMKQINKILASESN